MDNATPTTDELESLWAHHHGEWRDPLQVLSTWEEAPESDRKLLRYNVRGNWWDILAQTNMTLMVTREYEHLIMALTVTDGEPHITYMRLPHPSGIAYDAKRGVVHVACTRNPNQVLDLKPVKGSLPRLDNPYDSDLDDRPLVPVRSRFFPGALYMHDLAMIGGELYANSVGQNVVVRLCEDSTFERMWWPHAIEQDGAPVFGQNHIQLNSIAAGETVESSYFSASLDHISARRPGHKNFPVDKRGVIFSGATREVMARGLTRPHSARLRDGQVWVDNSGYGELGYAEDGKFVPAVKLPGWTRGLGFAGNIAFVGTSRVIPRFRQYAPGLEVDKSLCGLHAVDLTSGKVLGSMIWPYGNQIFAIELLPREFTQGFPFSAQSKRATAREKKLFYTFEIEEKN